MMDNITHDYNPVYVCLLDILGFKKLVLNNSHDRLKEIYSGILAQSVEVGLVGLKYKIYELEGEKRAKPDSTFVKVNSLIISDNVVFWTDDLTPDSFVNIVKTVKDFLSISNFAGLPMRGCLTTGPLYLSFKQLKYETQNIQFTYVGESVVKAYERSKNQEWAGCTVDQDCMKTYLSNIYTGPDKNEKLIENRKLYIKEIILPYTVPYKNGVEEKQNIINWAPVSSGKPIGMMLEDSFKMHKKGELDDSAHRKLKNTVRFLEFMMSRHSNTDNI